jgi:hypothetical protein
MGSDAAQLATQRELDALMPAMLDLAFKESREARPDNPAIDFDLC